MRIKKLSIVIPVFNEEKTILKVIKRVKSVRLGEIKKEIVVVNDGSTDGTKNKLKTLDRSVKVINKTKNQGKGAAIRDALKQTTGDYIVIQDADLEYNPKEYSLLLKPVLENEADVVFGSRFITTQQRRVLYFWHSVGNSFLTLLTNMLTNINLSDMETCYKLFSRDIAKNLNIKENRFGFEPEFAIKVAKMNCKIFEVGISYSGRNYKEGKKINGKDGVWCLWCIMRYSFFN